MKTCPVCLSTAFDDMSVCFGCLQAFDDVMPVLQYPAILTRELEDDWEIEEPSELPPVRQTVPTTIQVARFHVVISELFGYDIYLRKEEGAELTIGCARDNNIVLPHTESRRHLLKLFYSQGKIWVQDKGSLQKALIGDTLLTGTRCLILGSVLQVGEARIELIDE